jgi:hypothetical protein
MYQENLATLLNTSAAAALAFCVRQGDQMGFQKISQSLAQLIFVTNT